MLTTGSKGLVLRLVVLEKWLELVNYASALNRLVDQSITAETSVSQILY